MRRASSILVCLLLSATFVRANPSQSQLLGTWVAVHRSMGALGWMCTFLPGGKLEMSVGPMVEAWYRVDGNKLIEPPGTTNGAPSVTLFRVEGNTLIQRPEKGGDLESRFARVGKADAGAAPIVGVWRPTPQATAASIMKERRKAGQEVDAETADAIAFMSNHQYREYTRDGLTKFRLPMRTTPGTYDLANQIVKVAGERKGTGRFRLEDGLLVFTWPDSKTDDRYVRADSTKEQLKRAGIRYGNKPAELDPPPSR